MILQETVLLLGKKEREQLQQMVSLGEDQTPLLTNMQDSSG